MGGRVTGRTAGPRCPVARPTFRVRDLIRCWNAPPSDPRVSRGPPPVENVLDGIQADLFARHPAWKLAVARQWRARRKCVQCGGTMIEIRNGQGKLCPQCSGR